MNEYIKNDKRELRYVIFDFWVKLVIETETPKISYTLNLILIC